MGPIERNWAQNLVAVVGDYLTCNIKCQLDSVLSLTHWLAKNVIEYEILALGWFGEYIILLKN